MAGIIEPDLEKYFSFLSADHGFEKKEEYSIVREVFNDYYKEGMLIKFIFDGTLRVNISKTTDYKQSNFFSERNFKKIIHLNPKTDKGYFLRIYNEEGHFEEQGWLIADKLRNNPEILDGELSKLSMLYQVVSKNWK